MASSRWRLCRLSSHSLRQSLSPGTLSSWIHLRLRHCSSAPRRPLKASFHGPHSLLLSLRPHHLPILASQTSQSRSHAGHSHSHSHRHDNTFLTSRNKKDPGVRITRVGLAVNFGMAVVKGAGGYFFHSQALLADAVHAMTDLVSDVVTLLSLSWSWRPPTARFPTGYGKIESLGSLGVSGLLLGGGVFMAMNACNSLYPHLFLDGVAAAEHALHSHAHAHGHGHSHAAADMIPDIKAAWLAAGTIVVKEWLYRATMKVARERKSSVLASNAVHHRVDSLTGLVAFVAVGGAHVLDGATWLDPVGSLIVSILVIRAGWANTTSALLELADAGVDDEVKDAVRQAALKAAAVATDPSGLPDDKVTVIDVQGSKSGQNYLMEVLLAAPDHWTIEKTRMVEKGIREGVASAVRGVRRVKVQFVTAGLASSRLADEFVSPDVSGPKPLERPHSH